MASFPRRALSRLRIIVAAVMVCSFALPGAFVALAQSTLSPGGAGLIANAGGNPVLLREAPYFGAAALASYPEGTPADIVEGPVYSDDGTAWYGVTVDGQTGYMAATYLVDSGQGTAPAPVAEAPAQTLADDGTVASEPPPAPAASLSDVPASPATTADLNLRSGPSYDDSVMLVIPAGTPLTLTGDWSAGFAGVTYQGQYGWVDSTWLGGGAAPAPETSKDEELLQTAAPATDAVPTDAEYVGDVTASPAGDAAFVLDVANMHAGPAETDPVLRVLPAGGAVTITGPANGDWTPVWYNGTWGFVPTAQLNSGAKEGSYLAQTAAPEAAPAAPEPTTSESGDLQATTLSDINLRAAPDMTADVLEAIPAGVALTPLSEPEGGFYQVQYGDQTGWVSGEYLQLSTSDYQKASRETQKDEDQNQKGKVEGSEPATNADPGAGGVIWPITGGDWYVMQGYNGSSHQNQDGLWQYYYSLDLTKRDGDAAGQEIISPVNGVVRWTDPSTGGISIDIGNDHAVAMFHVTFLDSLEAGTPVSQGQHTSTATCPAGAGRPSWRPARTTRCAARGSPHPASASPSRARADDAVADLERRLVRYRLVTLLSAPDEIRGARSAPRPGRRGGPAREARHVLAGPLSGRQRGLAAQDDARRHRDRPGARAQLDVRR